MKFGVAIPPVKEWVEHVKLAEKWGFDYIWRAADYLYADSFASLAFVATKTKRVKLASLLNSVYLRHPVLIASGTSMIDEISGGRAVLGLCSAGYEATVKLEIEAREPITACREAIQIIKALWKGKPVSYRGKIYKLNDVKLPYKVRQDIPVYLGTRGAKFELAGEFCEGTVTHGKSLKFVERIIDQVKKGAQRAGKKGEEVDISTVLPFKITKNTEDERAFKNNIKPLMAGYIGGEYSLEWIDSLGFTLEEVEPIREMIRKKNFDRAVKSISDKMLEKLVDAFCIVGNSEECISEIEELEKAGLTQIIPQVNSRAPRFKEEMRGFFELFGKKIIQSYK